MLRFPFIILFTLAGSFAQEIYKVCEIDECYKTKKELNWVSSPKDGFPSIEKIEESCPSVFEVAGCIEKKLLSCTGKALSNLKSSENISISSVATGILNLRKVALELCDKNSDLHKNYERNINCTTKVFKEDNTECWAAGKNNWDKYLAEKRNDNHIDPLDFKYGHQETICIEMAYRATCLVVRLHNECGQTAKSLFTDIAFDGLEIFKSFICKPIEHSEMIPEFLNSLNDLEVRNTLRNAVQGSDYSNSGRTHVLLSSRIYILIVLFSWLLLW